MPTQLLLLPQTSGRDSSKRRLRTASNRGRGTLPRWFRLLPWQWTQKRASTHGTNPNLLRPPRARSRESAFPWSLRPQELIPLRFLPNRCTPRQRPEFSPRAGSLHNRLPAPFLAAPQPPVLERI